MMEQSEAGPYMIQILLVPTPIYAHAPYRMCVCECDDVRAQTLTGSAALSRIIIIKYNLKQKRYLRSVKKNSGQETSN